MGKRKVADKADTAAAEQPAVESPFVDTRRPVRVEYPNGLWWDFKARLSYGDRCELKRPYIKMGLKNKNKLAEQLSHYALEREQARVLLVASVAWNFPDPKRAGKVAEITLENILRLDEDQYVLPAVKLVEGLYGNALGADEQKKTSSVAPSSPIATSESP